MYFEPQDGKIIFKKSPAPPKLLDGQILIETQGCGLCRSDVHVYDGLITLLPNRFGHEGYGVIIESKSHFLKSGDYVVALGDPAFSDFFVVDERKVFRIPSLEPKWAITEPLACVLNALDKKSGRTLVLGRGFSVALLRIVNELDPILMLEFEENAKGIYNTVIEMSGRGLPDINLFNDNARLIWFSTLVKPVVTNFWEWSWKALEVDFPSPRRKTMNRNMMKAVELLKQFNPPISHIFSFEDAPKAFEIASRRLDNYVKGVFVK